MSQSLAKVLLHVIYSTKDRDPFLADQEVRRNMHSYLATVFKEYDSPALLIGGVADHVHILCLLSRTHSISEVIREAKRNSSKWIKTQGNRLEKFRWQSGYGAFSVSQSQAAQVKAYISTQERHHQRRSFQDEYRDFLKKYEVEYDERYVWD